MLLTDRFNRLPDEAIRILFICSFLCRSPDEVGSRLRVRLWIVLLKSTEIFVIVASVKDSFITQRFQYNTKNNSKAHLIITAKCNTSVWSRSIFQSLIMKSFSYGSQTIRWDCSLFTNRRDVRHRESLCPFCELFDNCIINMCIYIEHARRGLGKRGLS